MCIPSYNHSPFIQLIGPFTNLQLPFSVTSDTLLITLDFSDIYLSFQTVQLAKISQIPITFIQTTPCLDQISMYGVCC